MSRVCEICGKHKTVGGDITYRGLAKKKGGFGLHVVKNTMRTISSDSQNDRVYITGRVN